MLADSTILVTGGTGSFGKALIGRLLSLDPPPRRIVIFSRDELKQYEMSCVKPFSNNGSLRYFLGDVRDRDRVKRALGGSTSWSMPPRLSKFPPPSTTRLSSLRPT